MPEAGGRVFIVGAGPGDPGLITVRGLECLRAADVVVHDRLVGKRLLERVREGARLIDVGKAPRGGGPGQEEINLLLYREAVRGNTVVRLKSGDPFVFGRGGEEAAALAAAVRMPVLAQLARGRIRGAQAEMQPLRQPWTGDGRTVERGEPPRQ